MNNTYHAMMEQLKYEVAEELGIEIPADGYWGYMATRDCGAIGGHMVRRLIDIAIDEINRHQQPQMRRH